MGTSQAMVVADPTKPDGRLTDVCGQAQRLHMVLEDLIHHRGTRPDTMGRSATAVHASPPWDARVAYLIFDLAQMVRGLERNLHLLISGSSGLRGGSDENTQLALRALPSLAAAVDAEVTYLTANQVESWCIAARTAIGEIEPLSRLPQLPGHSEPRCPWCERQSLRLQKQAGIVRCVNPICLDDDGNRPIAHAEIVEDMPLFRWLNGSTSSWRS
jgi:hypothetical protein